MGVTYNNNRIEILIRDSNHKLILKGIQSSLKPKIQNT